MVELGVFETLQAKIDEDVGFREKVREILQALDRQSCYNSRSLPAAEY